MRWIRFALVVGLVVLGVGPAPERVASADEARLVQEMKGIAAGFPFAGQAKSIGNESRGGGYYVEGIQGIPYPANDEKPPHVTFKVNWAFKDVGSKARSVADLDSMWSQSQGGGMPKGGEQGTFGQRTWSLVTVERGTMDPNMSGDPYMSYAQAYAMTECGNVWVGVGIGVYSHASHGARNKPDVMEAIKQAAADHLRNVFGQILAVMRYGCSGEPPPPQPKDMLQAEPACQRVRLVRGKLPSEECGIYVRNWPPNKTVATCFPAKMDAWGLLPGGIIATFTNEFWHVGAVVAKGRTTGEYYLPIWWYAQCQATPGIHTVEVRILEGGPANQIGGCPASGNMVVVLMEVEVLAERSGNCDMRSNPGGSGGGSGPGGQGGGSGGGGAGGGGSGGGSGGGTSSILGRWRTSFGDLVLTGTGDGNARGTLGTSGAVVIGKVKDGEFIGTFTDAEGDGLIHVVTLDGTKLDGEWKRSRGPTAGTAGRIDGTRVPDGGSTGGGAGSGGSGPGGTGPGGAGGGPGDLPGGGGGTGGGPGGAGTPGGPGTSTRPPTRPIPAPLTGLTLQAPELRVTPGQEIVVPIWLLNAQDVTNMNWELTFDTTVAQASTAAGTVGKGNLLTEAFEANPAEAGRARMGFAQKKAVNGTGTVSVHRMKVIGAVGTRTPLKLAVPMITDSRPKQLAITLIDGWIEVVAPGSTTPGSTGGGPPTLQDAYNALKMSVGLMPENLALDMDRDGKVTSLDAWLIMTTVFLTMQAPK